MLQIITHYFFILQEIAGGKESQFLLLTRVHLSCENDTENICCDRSSCVSLPLFEQKI